MVTWFPKNLCNLHLLSRLDFVFLSDRWVYQGGNQSVFDSKQCNRHTLRKQSLPLDCFSSAVYNTFLYYCITLLTNKLYFLHVRFGDISIIREE